MQEIIFFCEFDGPREKREIVVTILSIEAI